MAERFVIRNQEGYYLSKAKEWVDGRNSGVVLNLAHYDQALNELIEVNSKEIWVRGSVFEVETDEKGRIQLEIIVPEIHEDLLDEATEEESQLLSESL